MNLSLEKKLIILWISLGNFAISFNTGAIAAAIPTISHDLSLPEFSVAKIIPYYMIPYGFGALLYAPLSRHVSYRNILMCAMAVYALLSLICGLFVNLQVLLLAQIGMGIASASSTPMSLIIIGELFEKNIRGRLVGIYFGCSFLAALLGFIFLGFLPWQWLFFVPALMGTLTAMGLWFMRSTEVDRVHQSPVDYRHLFTRKVIRDIFGLIFLMSFMYHSVFKWYGIYLHNDYGLDQRTISFLLVIVSSLGLLGQQLGGYLSDKKGRGFSCFWGLICLGLGTSMLFGHYPIVFLVMILGMIGMGWTMCHNGISTVLTDFPDDDRPLIASLNSSVRFISGGIGFALSRLLVEQSFDWTFLGIGVIFLLLIYILNKIIPIYTPVGNGHRV